MKKKIEELLLSTGREGMANLLEYMGKQGFYSAPCSSQYHLCKVGGLAEHSMNVCDLMQKMYYSNDKFGIPYNIFSKNIKWGQIIITSLLHDLGKMGQYGKPNYVENILKSGKVSDSKPYTTNTELLSVPHEIRSIQIASQFIELTEEESFAILYHNALYGDLKYQLNGKERPLQTLLHFADLWVSRFLEV